MAQLVKCLNLDTGHDLRVCEFKPCIRLYAVTPETGACFRFCDSLSLCPSPAQTLSLKKKNQCLKNKDYVFFPL